MALQIVGDESVIDVPVHVDQTISEPRHRPQRFFHVGWTNPALDEHGEGVGAVGWRAKSFRRDHVAGQVEAAFDRDDKMVFRARHLVGIRQQLGGRKRGQTTKATGKT